MHQYSRAGLQQLLDTVWHAAALHVILTGAMHSAMGETPSQAAT